MTRGRRSGLSLRQSPIRIVGVGSPWGDDAAAWEALRQLQERQDLAREIEVHRAHGGERILDLIDGRGTLLLVDALAAGTAPGTIHRYEWPDPRIGALRPGSSHDFGPAEALQLATALEIAPPCVVVFGIEVENVGLQHGLSPAVAAAIPELVRRILASL